MTTVYYKNHYGLNADTRKGVYLYHTMKVYSGEIVTSVNYITSEGEGSLISEPMNMRVYHGKCKPFTKASLERLHNEGVKQLEERIQIEEQASDDLIEPEMAHV